MRDNDERLSRQDDAEAMPDVRDDDDDDEIECWCGASGTYEDLFDDSGLEESCGGTGYVHCFCGGDLCACHNHGETECPGCDECEEFEDEHDDYDGD